MNMIGSILSQDTCGGLSDSSSDGEVTSSALTTCSKADVLVKRFDTYLESSRVSSDSFAPKKISDQDRSYEDTRTKAEKEQITLECCQLIQNYKDKLPIDRLPEAYKNAFNKKLDTNSYSTLEFITKNLNYFKYSVKKKTLGLTDKGKELLKKVQDKDNNIVKLPDSDESLWLEVLGSNEKEEDFADLVDINSMLMVKSNKPNDPENEIKFGIPDEILDALHALIDAFSLIGGVSVKDVSKLMSKKLNIQDFSPRNYGFYDEESLFKYLEQLGACKLKVQDDGEIRAFWNLRSDLKHIEVSKLSMNPKESLPITNFNLDKDATANITVYEIYGFKKFYMILEDMVKHYEQLNNNMTEFYRNYEEKMVFKEEDIIDNGSIVAVQHKISGFWQRAEILSVPRIGVYKILFIDDGDKQDVGVHDIRKLALRFAFFPRTSVMAGLYGLESNGSAMLKKANALFVDFVAVDEEEEAKVCSCLVKQVNPMKVVLTDQNGNIVNKMLVKEKFAKMSSELRRKEDANKYEVQVKKDLMRSYHQELLGLKETNQIKDEDISQFVEIMGQIKETSIWC